MNKIIYCFLAAAIVAAFFIGRNVYKDDYEYLKQNQIAMTDTIHSLQRENGTLVYWKASHILKESELNDSIKYLQKELSDKIAQISEITGQIKFDTIYVDSTGIKVDTINQNAEFKFNDQWLSFNGTYKYNPPTLNIYNINIPVSLTVGVTSSNNIFINSDNPYLQISDIKGAYVIENMLKTQPQKRWHHGISFGFGFQYGLCNRKIDIGPQVGYNIVYSF